jgi:hypothetical protein
MLTQGLSIIFIDQLSLSHVCIYNFVFKSLMNEKGQYKGALERYISTFSFYSDDEFLLYKADS